LDNRLVVTVLRRGIQRYQEPIPRSRLYPTLPILFRQGGAPSVGEEAEVADADEALTCKRDRWPIPVAGSAAVHDNAQSAEDTDWT
jgi:hypothetical protein